MSYKLITILHDICYRRKAIDIGGKLTFTKIDGKRMYPFRWMYEVECDLRILGVHGWRRKAEDREK